jgi:hypothetical protein
MTKVGKLLMKWDVASIIEKEVKYRLDSWQFPDEPDEEQIRQEVAENVFEDELEFLYDYLTEVMAKKNNDIYWCAEVTSFGWQSLNGKKIFKADTGEELLRQILPKTECTFKIFNYGRGIALQNWHHDSPVGKEWYYIMPIGYRTYVKEMQ